MLGRGSSPRRGGLILRSLRLSSVALIAAALLLSAGFVSVTHWHDHSATPAVDIASLGLHCPLCLLAFHSPASAGASPAVIAPTSQVRPVAIANQHLSACGLVFVACGRAPPSA